MIIPIIYPTAMEFWAHIPPNALPRADLPDNYSSACQMNLHLAEDIANMLHVHLPLRLACSCQAAKRSNRNYCCTLFLSGFAPGSFRYLHLGNYEFYIACPELCFLQAAKELNLIDQIRFGCEMCATYVRDPHSLTGQSAQTPLTSAAEIRQYLAQSKGFKHIKKARRAAVYVLDHSNSPMETALGIIMILPCKLGGYGLPRAELNCQTELTELAEEVLGQHWIRPDFRWAKRKLAVEYNSNAWHLDPASYAKDANRIIALGGTGYKVLTITAGNVRNLYALDAVMKVIRRLLSLPDNHRLLEEYRVTRHIVFEKLFLADLPN